MIDVKYFSECLKHYLDHKGEIDKRMWDLIEKWAKEDNKGK